MTSRNTRQKAAIRTAIEEAGRPLSAAELLELAQARAGGLGIATVYRNLNSLLKEGWLAPVELPGGQTRYEMAGKAHHHHFHCEACGRVFELEGCLAAIDGLASPGFTVRRHELVLYGECPECAHNRGRRV